MSLRSAKLHQFHEMRKITLIKIWWYLKIYVNLHRQNIVELLNP